MMRALYSGVSGLKTHQTKMDVIGNNIANVNTYGYKSQRTTFKDSFYQTITGSSNPTGTLGGNNAVQVGYGSTINTIDVLHTSGGYVPTGMAMDLFIDGEGYFIAKDGNGSESYTRVGVLSFDGSGNLVDGNGNYICGYPVSRYDKVTGTHAPGDIILQEAPAKSASLVVNDVQIKFGDANGTFFNGFKIKTVSDATATKVTAEADVANKTITITTKDAAGMSIADMQTALQALTVRAGTGVLPKNVDPSLITATATKTGVTTIAAGVISTKATGGEDKRTTTILDKSNGLQTIKKPGTLIDTDGDNNYDSEAADVMELRSISIGPNGVITGQDSNGQIIEIGQIVLANIPNPGALTMEGDSYLKAISNTGDITYSTPGDGTVGQIVSGGLENSNVNLANELTDMIITQRGFQANSRIITVGDEMLQEIVNLKR
ncbi:MAG: flagellar hook-basal body complex protein [Oscillospiraceae bacterium]